MGSGIPQYRWRERHQSRKFRVQSYWRASPAQSGYHLTDLISSSIFAFRSVTFTDRGCVYLQPSRSAPDLTSAVSYCSTFAVAIPALTFSSTSQRYSTFPARVTRTFAYLNFGFTATHRFAGRVHGVVVQTR